MDSQTIQSNSITNEMKAFFQKRTKEHIDRVVKNMIAMTGYKGLTKDELTTRGGLHDLSKYSEPEIEGYIWLTWWHRCKAQNIEFSYPEGIKSLVDKACDHHLHSNLHHPESHNNSNDMGQLDIVEMVSDWTAMSQEFNQKSCISYVQNNISKWNFSDSKKEQIYEAIQELDTRLAAHAGSEKTN